MNSDEVRWWIRYRKRFLDETRAIQAVADDDGDFSNVEWDVSGTTARLCGTLAGAKKNWDFALVYPDLFPGVCPYIRPQDGAARWSPHQFGEGGSLCLELGPDNWKPEHTGADLLRSMKQLLQFEELHPPGESEVSVGSRHAVTTGQELQGQLHRLLDEGTVAAALASCNLSYGRCTFGESVSADALILWPKELPLGNALPVPHGLAHGTHLAREGRFFKILPPQDLRLSIDWLDNYEFAEFVIIKYFEDRAHEVFIDAPKDSLFVLSIADGPMRTYRLSNDGEKKRLKVVPTAEGVSKTRTPTATRRALGDKSIAIVGLGSIGSKVAVTLARSGTKSFVLVDDDILSFGNIARHEASFRDVGAHKVDVIADLIHQVSFQEPNVTKHKTRLLGQDSAKNYSKCIESIARADVIVDCTADGEVRQYLGELASRSAKTFVWAEVFAGGFGGLIACAIPNLTPCPRCVQHSMADYFASLPEAPSLHGLTDYSDGVLEADDNSVAIIANLAALRIKHVIDDPKSVVGAPAVMIGFERAWVFEHELDIRQIKARLDDYSCGHCWSPAADELILSEAELKEYEEAINRLSGK